MVACVSGTGWGGEQGLTFNGYLVENVLKVDVTVAQFSELTKNHATRLGCVVCELILRRLLKETVERPCRHLSGL